MYNTKRMMDVLGSFNYTGFNIYIPCDIDELEHNVDVKCVFVHEYIHYLQAVSTPYGIKRTMNYLSSISKIIQCGNESIIPPLASTDDKVMKKSVDDYNDFYKYYSLGEKHENITKEVTGGFFKRLVLNPLDKRFLAFFCIPSRDKLQWVALSPLSLEETMATIAMLVRSGRNDKAIYDFLMSESLDHVYTAIYVYFYENVSSSNCAEIVFKFCELCLKWTEPHRMAPYFLEKIMAKRDDIKDVSKYFDDLVISLKLVNHIDKENRRCKKELREILGESERIRTSHHFGECMYDLAHVMLDSTEKNFSLWSAAFDKNWEKCQVSNFGCPVVHLDSGDPFIYKTQCKKLEDTIDYIYAVNEVLLGLISSKPSKCPFYWGICSSGLKKTLTCLYTSSQIAADENGACCSFRNSISLLQLDHIMEREYLMVEPKYFNLALEVAKCLDPVGNVASETSIYLEKIKRNNYIALSDQEAYGDVFLLVELVAVACSSYEEFIKHKGYANWSLLSSRIESYLGQDEFAKNSFLISKIKYIFDSKFFVDQWYFLVKNMARNLSATFGAALPSQVDSVLTTYKNPGLRQYGEVIGVASLIVQISALIWDIYCYYKSQNIPTTQQMVREKAEECLIKSNVSLTLAEKSSILDEALSQCEYDKNGFLVHVQDCGGSLDMSV